VGTAVKVGVQEENNWVEEETPLRVS